MCFLKDPARHTDLEVAHHGDVSRRLLAQSVIHHRVAFGPGYAAGGQNPIILVHAQRLPTEILDRQRFTETQSVNVLGIGSQFSLRKHWLL